MNINDFVRAYSAANYLGRLGVGSGQPAAGTGSSLQGGLKKADTRIQSLLDTNTAQLSAFGKLKSSLADTQTTARALSGLTSTTSAAAQRTAASQFVAAYNGAIEAARIAATKAGGGAPAQGASRVESDLGRAVASGTSAAASLKQFGIEAGSDGKLVLDATKFDVAQKSDAAGVLAGLVQLGQQVDGAATKSLAADGKLGASLAVYSQKASLLKNQQSVLSSLSAPSTSDQQDTGSYGSGLAAYSFKLSAYQTNWF
ncbi:MAG: hypothetical protein JWP29_1404 [Rhodoferax sp.]|nr:hypothetical protein [Rhodoferax sp.]